MRCKIGDLAILVGPAMPENLGALVEVLRPWRHGPYDWWVRSLRGPLRRNNGTVSDEAGAADVGLWPIRGDGRGGEVEVQRTLREGRAAERISGKHATVPVQSSEHV